MRSFFFDWRNRVEANQVIIFSLFYGCFDIISKVTLNVPLRPDIQILCQNGHEYSDYLATTINLSIYWKKSKFNRIICEITKIFTSIDQEFIKLGNFYKFNRLSTCYIHTRTFGINKKINFSMCRVHWCVEISQLVFVSSKILHDQSLTIARMLKQLKHSFHSKYLQLVTNSPSNILTIFNGSEPTHFIWLFSSETMDI